eukprot:s63_g49.t1
MGAAAKGRKDAADAATSFPPFPATQQDAVTNEIQWQMPVDLLVAEGSSYRLFRYSRRQSIAHAGNLMTTTCLAAKKGGVSERYPQLGIVSADRRRRQTVGDRWNPSLCKTGAGTSGVPAASFARRGLTARVRKACTEGRESRLTQAEASLGDVVGGGGVGALSCHGQRPVPQNCKTCHAAEHRSAVTGRGSAV